MPTRIRPVGDFWVDIIPTFPAISADGRVSPLIRAGTAKHEDAAESIMHATSAR